MPTPPIAQTFSTLSADPKGPPLVPAIDPASALVFVINAASGRNDPATTRQVIETALKAAGRSGELLFARPQDLPGIARKAALTAMQRRTAVVAVGGDGTINAVAQAAHAQGCALGVMAQGTFNYFARTHGLSTEPATALKELLQSLPLPVQVGLVNERVFLVNASLGLYPELLQDREAYKARFGRSRLVAFGSALITLLSPHRLLRLRVERGVETRDVTTPTLFVGNNRLQLEQVGLAQAPALDQGRIAAVMLRPVGRLAMLGLILRGSLGSLGEADTIESFKFRHMVVKPRLAWIRQQVKVAIDGEVGWMRAPLEFQVSPRPLYLLKSPVESIANITGAGTI